jgi:predicted DNA-binding transcriptional regulator AlpA
LDSSWQHESKLTVKEGLRMSETITIPWPEDEPTVSVYPTAAQLLGMGRSSAYDTVKRGEFPVRVIACGNKLRVPTADLRRLLGLAIAKPSNLDDAA